MIRYPIVADAKQLIEKFQINAIGYPTLIVLNKKEEVVEFKTALRLDEINPANDLSNIFSELTSLVTSEIQK